MQNLTMCNSYLKAYKLFFAKKAFITPGVNFINTLRTNFLYETLFWQLFSSYKYVNKRHSYEKFVHLMLMKLTMGGFLTQNQSIVFHVFDVFDNLAIISTFKSQ